MKHTPASFEAILLDEELQAERVLVAWWTAFRRAPPMTTGLTLACVLVHALSGWVDLRLRGFSPWMMLFGVRGPEALIAVGGRSGARVLDGELWRLFSCLFVHGDLLHIGMNGVALFGLGRLCEAVYGPTRLLTLFLACGLCGSLLSQAGGTPLSVGASGSVFGLLGAGVVFGLRHRALLAPPLRSVFGQGLLPWVALNLAIGFVIPGIDNLGHIGGLFGGLLAGLILQPRVLPEQRQSGLWTGVMAALCALTLGWTGLEMLASTAAALP